MTTKKRLIVTGPSRESVMLELANIYEQIERKAEFYADLYDVDPAEICRDCFDPLNVCECR